MVKSGQRREFCIKLLIFPPKVLYYKSLSLRNEIMVIVNSTFYFGKVMVLIFFEWQSFANPGLKKKITRVLHWLSRLSVGILILA